jgi:hypothetical protein
MPVAEMRQTVAEFDAKYEAIGPKNGPLHARNGQKNDGHVSRGEFLDCQFLSAYDSVQHSISNITD